MSLLLGHFELIALLNIAALYLAICACRIATEGSAPRG